MVKYYYGLIAALVSIAVLKLKSSKDTTAQGVAKVRHCESMLENPSERLYEDPYAHQMYYGSIVQTWLGGNNTRKIFNWYVMGMFDLLTLRTKWIDDEVLKRATSIVTPTTNGDDAPAEQLIILGAGYDTRGFRLDLPDGFVVVEVDQPDVQSRKRQIMTTIAKTDTTVASRMASSRVTFLAIDFNKDSISETLLMSSSSSTSLLKSTKKTIVILEGVTQYIPEASTASTLKQIHDVFSEGTILLISYVPRSVFDSDNKRVSWLLKVVGWFGEPWVTSWSPQSFASFLKQCGYEVLSDLSVAELNEKYLVPRNRGLARDDLLYMERYVVASVVK